jgi:heme A synthase
MNKPPPQRSLHLFALLLAVCAILAIGVGASLTSEIRPMPGSTGVQTQATAPALETAHQALGWLVAALTLGLAIWLRRISGWIALALAIVESLLGGQAILHAVLAPIFFSAVVACCVVTTQSWQQPPQPVEELWGPVKILAIAVPVLLVMQIGLGAAFRHNAMGVMSHIGNAMIVLLVILVLGVCLLRQYPEHPSLRPAALALLIIAGVQVLLGFAVYLVLLMTSENNAGLIMSSATHVVTGALTLGASIVLAMQLRRAVTSQTGH